MGWSPGPAGVICFQVEVKNVVLVRVSSRLITVVPQEAGGNAKVTVNGGKTGVGKTEGGGRLYSQQERRRAELQTSRSSCLDTPSATNRFFSVVGAVI